MIGRIDPSHREVTVVGAGISGLLAAYYLDRAGYEVTLHEAKDRAGGLIFTQTGALGISETAAHSLLVNDTARALFADLGVKLLGVRPDARARYIWRPSLLFKPMRRFPLRFMEFIGLFLRAYFILAKPAPNLTVEEWTKRHLGQPALDYLVTPFVRGIYGCEPSELLLGLAFPALVVPRGHSLLSYALSKRWARPFGSGKRQKMMAPSGGMGALIAALRARLTERLGERFRLNSEVEDLPGSDNLVLALPAPAAARLLARASPELSAVLKSVRYSPLISVTVFVARESFVREPRGVGVLFPKNQNRKALGILFNSSSFEGRVADSKYASFTFMLGDVPDERVKPIVRTELREVLGSQGEPEECVTHRWPAAVPRYDGNLRSALDCARLTWCAQPGRVLFGNFTGQVSIRGMIDSASQMAAPLQR